MSPDRGEFSALPSEGASWRSRLGLYLRGSFVRTLLCVVPVVLAISYFYAFIASNGTFQDQHWQLSYYDRMAEGFRHGHLYLVEEPNPTLLSMEDPFRYGNGDLWLWDSSLYDGHYYLYWGPIPALGLWAFKAISGSHEVITDQWPTVILMLGRLYAGTALILSLVSRLRSKPPAWLTTLAVAVFGLAHPIPFIVARPYVYEGALAGGQFFLFLGLLWAFWGLARLEKRTLYFLCAGLSWALSLGCRVTNFIPVPLLVVLTLVVCLRGSPFQWRTLTRWGLALGLPVAVGGLAYADYNYARFDSVFEFGTNHQLTAQPFYGYSEYLIPNIFSYLFGPLSWSCEFPYATVTGYRPLSPLITWPPGYQSFEKVGGIMFTTTWCWLSVLCVFHVIAQLRAGSRTASVGNALAQLSLHEGWLLACAIPIMLSMAPVLTLWEASMRYVGDALGGLCMAVTISVFWAYRRTMAFRRRWLGRALHGVVLLAGIQTCVIGASTSFLSGENSLPERNPTLYWKIARPLSLCPVLSKLVRP